MASRAALETRRKPGPSKLAKAKSGGGSKSTSSSSSKSPAVGKASQKKSSGSSKYKSPSVRTDHVDRTARGAKAETSDAARASDDLGTSDASSVGGDAVAPLRSIAEKLKDLGVELAEGVRLEELGGPELQQLMNEVEEKLAEEFADDGDASLPDQHLSLDVIAECNLDADKLLDLSDVEKGIAALTHVHLEDAQLISLCPGDGEEDALPRLGAVTNVYLHRNRLASLAPLGALAGLRFVAAAHNRLRSVDGLAALPNLMFLDVSHNEIESLPAGALPRSLRFLQVEGNRLPADTVLSLLAGLPMLKSVDGHEISVDDADMAAETEALLAGSDVDEVDDEEDEEGSDSEGDEDDDPEAAAARMEALAARLAEARIDMDDGAGPSGAAAADAHASNAREAMESMAAAARKALADSISAREGSRPGTAAGAAGSPGTPTTAARSRPNSSAVPAGSSPAASRTGESRPGSSAAASTSSPEQLPMASNTMRGAIDPEAAGAALQGMAMPEMTSLFGLVSNSSDEDEAGPSEPSMAAHYEAADAATRSAVDALKAELVELLETRHATEQDVADAMDARSRAGIQDTSAAIIDKSRERHGRNREDNDRTDAAIRKAAGSLKELAASANLSTKKAVIAQMRAALAAQSTRTA